MVRSTKTTFTPEVLAGVSHFSTLPPVGVAMTPPDGTVKQRVQGFGLQVRILLGGHEDDLHAVAAGLPHDTVGQPGEERVGQVGDHEADGEGVARAELAGRRPRPVAELTDDPQHLFALGRRDRPESGLSTRETTETETPAAAATSRMVGAFFTSPPPI